MGFDRYINYILFYFYDTGFMVYSVETSNHSREMIVLRGPSAYCNVKRPIIIEVMLRTTPIRLQGKVERAEKLLN